MYAVSTFQEIVVFWLYSIKNNREMKEIQILRQLAFVQLCKDLKICHQVQI